MTYSPQDVERRHEEPAKAALLDGVDRRLPFTRDRARVLHSAALRVLAGKTQVVDPGEGGGVPRTRLTHSLEVAQIGRGIAADLGADPDLVDMAGLAHDIGHPPFGHNGEEALNDVSAACGGYEGNAQTLRILTRLEPKVVVDGRPYGLNLTRASLDATTKYPWPRPSNGGKFGVYDADVEAFRWMREGAPDGARCLEAQIMDWADDVAYSVHDVEDGVYSGRIAMRVFKDPAERDELADLAARHYSSLPVDTLRAAAAELPTLPAVADLVATAPAGREEFALDTLAAIKRMTSELVGRFATAAVAHTRAKHGDGPLTRYNASLEVPDQVAAEVAVLKSLALRYVMNDEARRAVQAGQREMLAELVEAVTNGAPSTLDRVYGQAWEQAADDAGRLRVVVDQIAALTDEQAVAWHRRYVRSRQS